MIGVGFLYLPAPPRRSVGVLLRTPAATAATSRDCGRGPEFLHDRVHTRPILAGAGSPMTDVAYLCSNCGSLHEVESIRENLILDLRTAASYELSGHRDVLDPHTHFVRWRMTRGLARALWPGYSRPWLAWGRRPEHGLSAPVSDRPVPCRAAASDNDTRADGNPALAGIRRRRAGSSVSVHTSALLPRQDHDRPA